jgi:hypothetical protein
MRLMTLLAMTTLVAGCWMTTPEPEAPSAQKVKAASKTAKAKGKAKAKGNAPSKAKAKARPPSKPPPEYGAEGPVTGRLLLTKEPLEEGKSRTKAELAISWTGGDGGEAGEATILLGHAPGACEETTPTPFTENDTEITPLWSARCTHDKATAVIVLYQAGNLLLIKRSVLGAEDRPGPWKPIKKVRFAKGAQLTR